MVQKILFILINIVCFWFAYKSYSKVIRAIKLGNGGELPIDNRAQRWKNVVLIALGQKKMFKRIVPAVMHLFIYVAFIFTQIELLEIFIDGIFGTHRFFSFLGGFYNFIISLIELLSVLAFIGTIVFLSRRNLLKLPRFTKSEMMGWPFKDGNLILIGELLLLLGIFSMNGADNVLQSMGAEHYAHTGGFAVSSMIGPAFFGGLSEATLVVIERMGWWLHFGVVMGFILYLPISKHLHIFFAFPNVFYANINARGEMENMPEIMNEVKMMMGLVEETVPDPDAPLPEFGANDVMQLSKLNILNAYSCTECGRCTDMCPANKTGKKLSPRKIMMDVRDRATLIEHNIANNNLECIKSEFKESGVLTMESYDDGKSLFDTISREEIHACTTCTSCIEACPILINPMDIILKLRRYEILTESAGPADWVPMFNSIENSGAVWQFPEARDAWKEML